MANLIFTGGLFQAIGDVSTTLGTTTVITRGPLPGALLYTYAAGTTTPLATYTPAGSSNTNPVECDANGQAHIDLGPASYHMVLKTSAGVTVWDRDNIPGSGTSSAARNLTGALAVTQAQINNARQVDAVLDFGVPNDGTTNATTAIQAMITALASTGISDIVFAPGTYLLQSPASETGEPRSYAAAVVWKQLRNVTIRGSKTTKFTQSAAGAGAPEFAMFRFEECENVEMLNFSADGSGITINGIGAARSSFAFICNHNLDTKADLTIPNRNIHIHDLILDNFGGGICSATRTEAGYAYPLITKGVSVHDIQASNISGQNHFVGLTYTETVRVSNCKAINALTLTAQIGNLFADMSAGVVNAVVENNYAVGFTGGGKAETHTGCGLLSNEDRPSQNVVFSNNTFEQMGDPITMIYPGAGGGGFYGIKLNGINHKAIHNTITARTTSISTGGLYQGIQLTSTSVTPVETVLLAFDNDIRGSVIGINHDSPVDTSRRFTAEILANKIRDTATPATPVATNDGTGIIVSRNAVVRGNKIHRTKRSAVLIQSPDLTYVERNYAFDCSDTNNATISAKVVYAQAGSGAQGYFEFEGNVIVDSRGGSAAAYGYYLEGAATVANKYVFRPGYTDGIATGVAYDKYFSYQGISYAVDGITNAGLRTIYTTNTPTAIAPWNAMTWRVGDRAVNKTPAVGVAKAWSCTVAGAPGTWVSEGNL